MKRKLFSAMLGAFALLLLMGAASAPTQPAAALLAEEESAVLSNTALETEAQSLDTQFTQAVEATTGIDPTEAAVPVSTSGTLSINGQPAPQSLNQRNVQNTTYVALAAMAQALTPYAKCDWDGSTMTITTDRLSLTAKVGQLYVEANGRYLYIPEQVQLDEAGQVSVPLRTAAKAFDARVDYDGATAAITVTSGSGAIVPGDSFYNQGDLFWLSRVIYRESGNQSLEGQMAVGNVVLNRVADPTPAFPNTVEEVLAQKNQFSTYASGVLRKTEPSPSSIIAAKLVMDGGVVEETRGALYFDSKANSWAARNKQLITTFGGHNFYG